jgi:hypothetical protein
MGIDPSPIRPASIPTCAIDTFRLEGDQSREVWRSVVDGTFELEGRTGTGHAHRVGLPPEKWSSLK